MAVAHEKQLRPTAARIRETLFNWLAPVTPGSRCLDLFAGSGALGFEALSRGAGAVVFVENSTKAIAALHDNARLLGTQDATVVHADAWQWLGKVDPQRFDIVFLDPPFAAAPYEELCRLLAQRDWLAPGAMVYIELCRGQALPTLPDGWKAIREKTAGNVRYALIRAASQGGR